jgi:catechol 2,3-dioxygenase-like lactoylglutathione lyase family enzyme
MTQARSARSEPQASGVRAPAKAARSARSEPQASGVRAPAKASAKRAQRAAGERSESMRAELTRPALDLGVVTADAERALGFYRDTLGLVPDGEVRFPGLGVVHRLRCGESTVKLLALDAPPAARAPGGGFGAATGFRYCTLHVANLDALVAACRARGHAVPVDVRTLRPGVRVAMVEDPDGNTVELMGP